MPLYINKTINNDLKLVVWELDESLEELRKIVTLNDEDEEQFHRILRIEKKKELLAGRYVVKKGCKLLGIEYKGLEKDEYGKPHLKGSQCEISLTHTSRFIAVVYSATKAVGIDLERPRDKIMRVLPRLFSAEEILEVNNDLDKATIYWSAKEALYKLYGKRGVFFKENLILTCVDNELYGEIKIKDTHENYKFYIDKIEDYFLVIAYSI